MPHHCSLCREPARQNFCWDRGGTFPTIHGTRRLQWMYPARSRTLRFPTCTSTSAQQPQLPDLK